MLYDLVQRRRGKDNVVMTGALARVRERMAQLRGSQRGGVNGDPVTYSVRKAAPDSEKFKQKPHNINLSGGSSKHPRVPRAKKK